MRRPRLDPFAFAVDTDSRFVLLVVAVTTASFFLMAGFYNRAPDARELHAKIESACAERSRGASPLSPGPFEPSPAAAMETECVASANAIRSYASVGGTAALLGTAVVLYWAYPGWIRRRRRLKPLPAEEAAALAPEIDRIGRSIRLGTAPTFVADPDDRSGRALAFGRAGTYFVAVGRGLLDHRSVDPEAFRAILAHELAHIRDRDVDLAYLTVVLWRCFLVVAIAWVIVTSVGRPHMESLHYGIRLAVLAVVIYLTHAAVLRAREHYADVRASTDPVLGTALRRLFDHAREERRPSALRVHPALADRRATIADPDRLFTPDRGVAFAVGLVASAASSNIPFILSGLTAGDALAVHFLGSLAGASLLMWIVGLAIWRATFAATIRGEQVDLRQIALFAGAGWVAGYQLSILEATFAMDTTFVHLSGPAAIVLEAVVAALTIAAVALVIAWLGATARAWIPRALDRRSGRGVYVGALVLGSALLGSAFFLVSWIRIVRVAPEQLSGERVSASLLALGMQVAPDQAHVALVALVLLVVVLNPLTFVLGVAAWAFPLAAAARPSRSVPSSAMSWAFLDPPPDALGPRIAPVSPIEAARRGIAGGVGLGISIPIAVLLAGAVPLGPIVAAFIAVAFTIQAVVSASIARMARSFATTQAGFGTWSAATMACVLAGLLGNLVLPDRSLVLAFATVTWLLLANVGALAALVITPLASPRPTRALAPASEPLPV